MKKNHKRLADNDYHARIAKNTLQASSSDQILSREPAKAAIIACICAVLFIGSLAAPSTYSQSDGPQTVEVDVPFEMMAPWYLADGSGVEDEVMLRGTLHVTTRTWQTRPGHIDRFYLHANAVNIKGTSETTGQRFSLNGSFKFDLRDPEVTFSPDGTTFTIPMQPWSLHFHKVDPEPARLTRDLFGVTGATAASVGPAAPITIPCTRIILPDGTPTASLACGSTTISVYYAPLKSFPPLYRVVVGAGNACVPNTICVVPDGATLFNGYTGGYKPPLVADAKIYMGELASGNDGPDGAVAFRWHCATGNREVPMGTTFSSPGGRLVRVVGTCRPIYSSTEPIRVWGEVSYRHYDQPPNSGVRQVNTVIKEKEFRFRMDERPMDQPPVINTFSVKGRARVSDRCPIGEMCELADGDLIFNTAEGDYDTPLELSLSASDPEGDPVSIEWFCLSGSYFAPIVNPLGGSASCTPGYFYPGAILVYARVSDGNNVVWSQNTGMRRELYMHEFLH